MLCPLCANKGLANKPKLVITESQGLKTDTFKDPSGKEHKHDDATYTDTCTCPKKHTYQIQYKKACRSCSYNKTFTPVITLT